MQYSMTINQCHRMEKKKGISSASFAQVGYSTSKECMTENYTVSNFLSTGVMCEYIYIFVGYCR